MPLEKDLETRVDDILKANSVKKAERLIKSRSGTTVLAAISFIEASLPLPLLTDPFLIAAVLVDRAKTVRLVVATTVASVLGGVFAYFVALFFFETIQQLMSPGMLQELGTMIDTNTQNTFLLTLVGAVTPVPYTIVAWAVAIIKGGLPAFILASTVGRGARYAIVGYCTYRFGPLAISYIKRYIGLVSLLLLAFVVLYLWFYVIPH